MNVKLQVPEANARQRVPSALYWQSRFFDATKTVWKQLADIESWALADEIVGQSVNRPVYVCGLARSGTTVVTEMLNAHQDLTSHRYSDFPNVYTPYWRNWLLQRGRMGEAQAVERAHQDGLWVTQDSPEAVEEVLWNYFFPQIHDSESDQRLTQATNNAAFERFYREHIAKLLLVREAPRYLAKGNYNISRVGYISKIFPDARFVIPIRHPVNHIVSLYKQHLLFMQLQQHDKRTAQQLVMSGHFEFGPQRRCPNLGDNSITQQINDSWSRGDELQGWALMWRQAYGQVQQYLEDPDLQEQVMLLRYEDLCGEPQSCIDVILSHTGLPAEPFAAAREHYQSILKPPNYYHFDIDDAILEEIWDTVAPVAESFGYSRPL